MDQCDMCAYLMYDEEDETYYCSVDMDQDDVSRLMSGDRRSSCGEEIFDSEEGRTLMKEWGVPDNYICQGFVILGYIDGEQPVSEPRKPERVQIIE